MLAWMACLRTRKIELDIVLFSGVYYAVDLVAMSSQVVFVGLGDIKVIFARTAEVAARKVGTTQEMS